MHVIFVSIFTKTSVEFLYYNCSLHEIPHSGVFITVCSIVSYGNLLYHAGEGLFFTEALQNVPLGEDLGCPVPQLPESDVTWHNAVGDVMLASNRAPPAGTYYCKVEQGNRGTYISGSVVVYQQSSPPNGQLCVCVCVCVCVCRWLSAKLLCSSLIFSSYSCVYAYIVYTYMKTWHVCTYIDMYIYLV